MEITYTLPVNAKIYPFCNLLFDASHILIGGTNGSGKSVTIDDFIYNLLVSRFPSAKDSDGVQLVLIDPKKVSLKKYCAVPHTIGYADENGEIIRLLDKVIKEMDARYSEMQAQNITLYTGGYIVVVIDELADLMTTCKKDIFPRLQRIAQLGRAAKIKLIAGTQEPSRKIIPAELTVNFTGRLALRCVYDIESKQIIKRAGAELLPRYGKGLYLHADGKYYECNIPKTSDNEIMRVINIWKAQKPVKAESVEQNIISSRTYTVDDVTRDFETFNKKWGLFIFAAALIITAILFIKLYI